MTRTVRTRTRFGAIPGGSFNGSANGVPITGSNGSHYAGFNRSRCDDSAGRPPTDSNLLIERATYPFGGEQGEFSSALVNGHYGGTNPNYDGTAVNYIPSYIRGASLSHVSLPSMPSASSDALRLLALTNPSRPTYEPLTLIQDLIELPAMLQDVGHLIESKGRNLNAKQLANWYLGIQFGWKPLVEDVKSFLDVQSAVHQRIGELHRLYELQGGLKRKKKLGNWGNSDSSSIAMESFPPLNIGTRMSRQTTATRWGTVRWKPVVPLPGYRPDDASIIAIAKHLVSGFTPEGLNKGAWDLLPWTWIVNWCSNIGSYGQSHSNSVPALPSSINVMTHIETSYNVSVTSITPGYSWSPSPYTYETKERYVGSGSVDAHLPFLDMGRLSILESLFIQRFK